MFAFARPLEERTCGIWIQGRPRRVALFHLDVRKAHEWRFIRELGGRREINVSWLGSKVGRDVVREPAPSVRPGVSTQSTSDFRYNVLFTELALFPARYPEAELQLIADLLKASPLVRAALLLALLLCELFALRPGKPLAWFLGDLGTRFRPAVGVACAALRSIVVRDVASL